MEFFLFAFIILGLFFAGVVLVLMANWKMFEKAYVKGWKSFVPILNIWEMLKIANLNPKLILLFFIPGANVVMLVILSFKFTKRFGLGTLGGLSFIFFNTITILYLGYSDKAFYRRAEFE